MSYSSTNGTFAYTITNNTSYVVDQIDYDIILSAFNRWDNIMTIDSRFGSSYTITISFIIDTLDAGVLGGAYIISNSYITNQTYGNIVPLTANITMNNTHIGNMKTTVRNDGYTSYYHVLLHEIGHILGIGTFWNVTGCPKTSYDDNGTTKYYYTGTNALREYKSHFGNNSFVGIPIEDDGGTGTEGGHPEEGHEGSVSADNRYINGIFHPGLDTELMTGWLDGSPVSTPLSRITLGFLEDMGYTVNYNLADVYIMAWLATTDANNLEQTYIQGFLDVSGGNIINRNDNLSILQGTMDVSGAVAFNSRLDVGGDVSLNGTTIDICGNLYAQYPDNSIPAAAIDGQVEATPNFSGDVDFQSNVDISDNLTVRNKVAIGSTTLPTAANTALKVTGDLDFTGNLLNDGVAYVSGATDLNGLSDVISYTNSAGGAAGTLIIGSIPIMYANNNGFNGANQNTGVGHETFTALTMGDGNTGVGYNSLYQTTTGSYNTAIGHNSGNNSTGGCNTFIGGLTGTTVADCSYSTAIGYSATVTTSNQIMLGTSDETVKVPGDFDLNGDFKKDGVVFGLNGLSDVMSGGTNFADSILIGSTTTGTLVTAKENVGMGVGVFNALTEGDGNVGIGHNAATKLTTGSRNISVGIAANGNLETGAWNTTIGGYAQSHNITGNYNTSVGYEAGDQNIGSWNTYLGYGTKCSNSTDLSGSTAIGTGAQITATNQIMLGQTGTHAPSVVIPGPQLDVAGDIKFTGDLYQDGVLFTGGGNLFDSGDVSMNSNLAVGGQIAIGGDVSMNSNLAVGGQIAMGGHIHPTANAAYDLGNASYKIRHLFLSDNSLWVGDDHKVDVGGGKMKFKKRNKNAVPASIVAALVNGEAIDAAAHTTAAKTHSTKSTLDAITLNDWLAYAKTLGGDVGGTASADISIQDIYGNSNDADYESIQNADNTDINQLTINPIDVSVSVAGIQHLDQYLKFTIPNSMTALKYFCTSHGSMMGDFTLASSSTETDKTYYVRLVETDPQNTAPYYLFSDAPNGTALNDSSTQLTLYNGNTYTLIHTGTTGHPFMIGDSHNVTTGMKLESTGDGAVTASTYTNPYTLHVNGMANIENNLNVARALTVSGPIRQW